MARQRDGMFFMGVSDEWVSWFLKSLSGRGQLIGFSFSGPLRVHLHFSYLQNSNRVYLIASVAWIVTGPSRPDSASGSFLLHCLQMPKVNRPVGLGLPSCNHCGHVSALSVP